jgi:hypothetical protein
LDAAEMGGDSFGGEEADSDGSFGGEEADSDGSFGREEVGLDGSFVDAALLARLAR